MKTPTIKQAAEFCGSNEPTLHNWKKSGTINGIKVHLPYGKHNLFLGAMLSTYLFSIDYQNKEEAEFESNFERLTECYNKLQECCKPELIEPLKDFIKAVEKFEGYFKINNKEQKKESTTKYCYQCYDCNYEWKSDSNEDYKCPMCGSENIDYLGKKIN